MNRYNKALAYMMNIFIGAFCLSGWGKSVQELTRYSSEYGGTGWGAAKALLVLILPIFITCLLVNAILHGPKLFSNIKTFVKSIIGLLVVSLILEGGLLMSLTQWGAIGGKVLEVGIFMFTLLLIAGNFKTIMNRIQFIKNKTKGV